MCALAVAAVVTLLALVVLAASAARPAAPQGHAAPEGHAAPDDGTVWVDARDVGIEGKGWADTPAPYDRLPAKAEGTAPEKDWGLSHMSAGLCVRFATDAPALRVRWTLTTPDLAMPHMPATGVSGVDLYARD